MQLAEHEPRLLHEPLLRRPDWVAGEFLRLAHGEWSLPEVVPVVAAGAGPEGEPSIEWRLGDESGPALDPGFWHILREVQKMTSDEMERKFFGVVGLMAGLVLGRCYDLTPTEARFLIWDGFWLRALEDKDAIGVALACYQILGRVLLEQPLEALAGLLDGLHVEDDPDTTSIGTGA